MEMSIEEPVNIRKWRIVMICCVCCLCIFCFGLGFAVGRANRNSEADETIEATTTESLEETTSTTISEETTKETVYEIPTIPATVETIEETEPETKSFMVYISKETEAPVEKATETEPSETPSEAVSEPIANETEYGDVDYEVELLACAIYTEAGGDAACDDCRRRVADVILNRVADERFPDSIYDVLTQPGQYANGIRWPSRANNAVEVHAVERAYRIAEEVLDGQHSDIYGKGYIWQAVFVQGSSGFWCCGTYFGKG